MRNVDVQVQRIQNGYVAEGYEDFNGLRFSIVGEGATWEALKTDVLEVVKAIYYDTPKPDRLRLHHTEQTEEIVLT